MSPEVEAVPAQGSGLGPEEAAPSNLTSSSFPDLIQQPAV